MVKSVFDLDMTPGRMLPLIINVSQYDDIGRTIVFNLYSSVGAWTAPTSASVTFEGGKRDGKFFAYNCAYSNGTVTVTIQQQMTVVAGKVRCKVKVKSGDKVVESAPIIMVVDAAAVPDGSDMSKSDINDAIANATQKIVDQVKDNIPSDYSQLSTDVSNLKEDIDDCLKVKYLELKQDNLINIDNLTVGVCDSDGSFKDDTRYRRTDYEFVKPNTTYSSWRMIWKNAMGIVRIAFFDKNKKFISGGSDIGNIFTTPSDAYYVILTYVDNENLTKKRMPMVCEGNNVPEVYLPYKNEYIKKVVEYVKKDDLKPHAYMPDVIYCALGRTIDIYNNQVCIDADKFHLCWTCDIGFGEGRKFTVVPSTIGDHSLKLDIYDDNNILVWTKTSTLKVVNAKTSGSIAILPIGDSMTYGGATWQDEVSKKLSNGAITYVGSLEHSYRGTNYNHEGYNGATASNFLNSKMLRGLTNPFYNPDTSKFDWNYYKNNTRISPDVVQIELGTNDINGGTIEQAVSNIAEMVDLIRKDDANIPIFICNAIYRSNQNGIAHQLSTQGYSMGNGVYKFGEDIKIQSLMVSLVEKFTDYKNVYFIPLALCHDSENNFGKQKISLNSRSQEIIIIPADSIHPNKTGEDASIYGYDIVGYLQFADIMFSTFSALIN
uniref:Hydrolase n=1 Tax=Myoviridae sp. cthAo37 TaxID=2827701 RepID=A0A8S5S5I6_9CAUD|nr:MAG TPA: hydrolase [Myoviridae sp. cthAo37]